MPVINGTPNADPLNGSNVDDVISGGDGADTIDGGDGADTIYGYGVSDAAVGAGAITATLLTNGLSGAVFAAPAPGDADGLYVVQRGNGQIWRVDVDTGQRTLFLDIPDNEFSSAGEGGVLSVAFHPDYATNGRLFVFLENPQGHIEVREYARSSTNPPQADPASGNVILFIDHSQGSNHYGGTLQFGTDGYLYISVGDGGGPGGADPQNDSQNLDVLLGKILRIDVNGDAFGADPLRDYAIPATNPFASSAGADEIWALGLRNPYRFSIDMTNGDLWIGDVGGTRREEIDYQAGGAAGGLNFGWRIMEGTLVNAAGSTVGLTPPIHEYDHDAGVAIIGGYVYHGAGPAFAGHYWFADFASDRIWTLRQNGGTLVEVEERTDQIVSATGISQISSFGVDASGELYIVSLTGNVFRLSFSEGAADVGDTLRGGSGDDLVYGGAGADLIEGGADDDELHGGFGADTLNGDAGVDEVFGDDGDDVLAGGAGADILNGGAGADAASYAAASVGVVARLDTPAANTGDAAGDTYTSIENLIGSAQGDTLVGDGNANALFGLGGIDTLEGNDGGDTLDGEAGADTLRGGAGLDNLTGGPGGDVLDGGADFDYARYETALAGLVARLDNPALNTGDAAGDSYTGVEGLVGSAFNDTLVGAGGAQELWGRDGDDVLIGGAGADLMQGEEGSDTASYENAAAGLTVRLHNINANTGDADDDVYVSVENLRGSGHNDVLAGNILANIISGGAGADQIGGEGGNDELHGELGADQIWGNAGDDAIAGEADGDNIWGGPGADRIWGNDGADALDGQDDADSVWGGAGDDRIWGGLGDDALDGQAGQDALDGQGGADRLWGDDGNDNLSGGDGDDIIDAGNGEDTVQGGIGADQIYGQHGADHLFGGSGNDRIDGGSFNDLVLGEAGEDNLWGGAGADVFWFGAQWDVDIIHDFDHDGGDVLVFSGVPGLTNASQLGYIFNPAQNLTEFYFGGQIVWIHGFADMSDVIVQ